MTSPSATTLANWPATKRCFLPGNAGTFVRVSGLPPVSTVFSVSHWPSMLTSARNDWSSPTDEKKGTGSGSGAFRGSQERAASKSTMSSPSGTVNVGKAVSEPSMVVPGPRTVVWLRSSPT